MANPSTALIKRSLASEEALTPAPPPPKRIRRPATVLDEEIYTSALSYIIARDFFPSLLENEVQGEFLLALDSGNEEWIDEAGERVKQAMTPSLRRPTSSEPTPRLNNAAVAQTPLVWNGESTPSHNPATTGTRQSDLAGISNHMASGSTGTEQPDLSLSLASFQARYTSEDNESFNRVLDRHNAKKAAKYSWQRNSNRLPSARQIAQAVRRQSSLDSANSQAEHDRIRMGFLESAGSSQPQNLQLTRASDARPASVKQISQSQRNPLMFPKGQEDITETDSLLQTIADAAAARSLAPPKSIAFENTRVRPEPNAGLDTRDDETSSTLHASSLDSPSLSAIDDAIAGRLRSRQHVIPPGSSAHGGETPRVNGYAFVDEEPTPAEIRAVADSRSKEEERLAILSGIIEANMGIGSGGAGNPFHIATQSRREGLHHRMVEKTLAEKRQKKAQTRRPDRQNATPGRLTPPTGVSRTPRFPSGAGLVGSPMALSNAMTPSASGMSKRSQGNLTPAARLLYNKLGRTPGRLMTGSGSTPFDTSKNKGESSFDASSIRGAKR